MVNTVKNLFLLNDICIKNLKLIIAKRNHLLERYRVSKFYFLKSATSALNAHLVKTIY